VLFTIQICVRINGVAFQSTLIFTFTIKTANITAQSLKKPAESVKDFKPTNVWKTEVQLIETQQNYCVVSIKSSLFEYSILLGKDAVSIRK